MQYVTRGGITPQGIPKVYVTGHSSQFMQHFAHIKEDILKFSNCAVFYDPDPEHPEDIDPKDPKGVEKFKSLLKSMQLVVLVVTRRFVEEDTFAFSEVFQFANEETIPVLPILEENGIEAAFNEKCGNIQMLNPYSDDPTEISYEDKLKKRLDAVLIGDEMAEKIRAAFDAYVFLSYRKKDREQAQKLMQLIHSNDFCRDVAIWYDEFLVPGENFNDAIKDAMKKSDLFALTVTPNLLEEGNYVMTTEYPEAAKAKKPIMPVELEETDSKKLQEKYSEIPTILRADDAKRLEQALKQILGLDDTVRNNDPQHMFFIGLAYLSGIDVEVNQKLAVKLISAAAKKELPEAVEMMSTMYHEGQSVRQDVLKAIEIRKFASELRENRFRQTQTESDARQWMDCLFLLGDYLYGLGHDIYMFKHVLNYKPNSNVYLSLSRKDEKDKNKYYREALEIYKKLATVLEDNIPMFSDVYFERLLYITCDRMGRIYLFLNESDKAKVWYEKEFNIREKLVAQTDSLQELKDLSDSYYEVSKTLRKRGYLDDAIMYYEKGASFREKLISRIEDPAKRDFETIEYYFYCSRLADSCKEKNNFFEAEIWYKKALDVVIEMVDRKDHAYEADVDYAKERIPEASQKISDFYKEMGLSCKKQGDLAGAKAWYEKALVIAEKIAAQSDTVEAQRALSFSYFRLGSICEAQGDLAGAKECYEKMFVIFEKIAVQSDSVEAQKDLAETYNILVDICRKQGDLDGVKKWYKKELAHIERQAAQSDSAKIQGDIGVLYGKLADICEKQGDHAEAKEWYEKQIAIIEGVAASIDSVDTLTVLSIYCSSLSDICKAHGDLAGAKIWHEKTLVVDEKIEACKFAEEQRELADSYDKHGEIFLNQGDFDGAKEWFEKALVIREKIAPQIDPEIDPSLAQKELIISRGILVVIGNICKAQNDLAGAKERYEKALVIDEKIAAQSDSAKVQSNLSASYSNLGDICEKQGDFTGAKEWYEKEIVIREKLAEKNDSVEVQTNLADSYENLGYICEKQGDFTGAKEWYEKGLVIRERLVEKNNSVEALSYLFRAYTILGNMCKAQGNSVGATEYIEKADIIIEKLKSKK